MDAFIKFLVFGAMTVCIAGVLPADEENLRADLAPPLPKTPPPLFGIASIRDGMLKIRYVESVAVVEQRVRTLTQVVDGKTVTREIPYKRNKQVTKAVVARWTSDQYRVFQGGKQLDDQTKIQLLKQPTRVILVEDTLPDEFYLSLLKADTIVVVVDPLATMQKELESGIR